MAALSAGRCSDKTMSWTAGVQFSAGVIVLFLIATLSISSLGPTESPILWVGGSYPRGEATGAWS